MGIDRLKVASVIKIFVFLAYFFYFSISNTSLIKFFEDYYFIKPDTDLKRELLSSKCLLLLGGSNIRMGLSAEDISIKSCEALNLGIGSEGGGFKKYLNWLNNDIYANIVIYSPALVWQSSPFNKNSEVAELKFPQKSIYSFINSILLNYVNEKSPSQFNKFGDQMEYKCLSNFPSFDVEINKFIESSHSINQEIYNRIFILKRATNSGEILLRVPPVYVKNKNQAELYNILMNNRIEMLKGLDVKMIGSTFASVDNSLFCDSLHPNAKGRKAFSKEIVLPL